LAGERVQVLRQNKDRETLSLISQTFYKRVELLD